LEFLEELETPWPKSIISCPVKLSGSGSPRNDTTFEKVFGIVLTLIGCVVHFPFTYHERFKIKHFTYKSKY